MTQIALITGASRGLGYALAEALAPEYHIVAVARTVGGLEAVSYTHLTLPTIYSV